ncbi:hypothetical protein U1Q18_030967 [Sarracenia purpurea var. burkii]
MQALKEGGARKIWVFLSGPTVGTATALHRLRGSEKNIPKEKTKSNFFSAPALRNTGQKSVGFMREFSDRKELRLVKAELDSRTRKLEKEKNEPQGLGGSKSQFNWTVKKLSELQRRRARKAMRTEA